MNRAWDTGFQRLRLNILMNSAPLCHPIVRAAMRRHAKRAMVIGAGWVLLLIGVTGVIMPILPGIPFLVVGLLILSGEYVWAGRLLGWVRSRFPKMTHHAEKHTKRWTDLAPAKVISK